jgi:hypothetical protein
MSREATALWRKAQPDKWKAINARYRLKLKVDVLTHYAGGEPICWCCGESTIQFLGLDHMDNDGAKERQSIGGGHATYRWLKTNGYPERNFKVACQNCNSTRYYYGVCPHQMVIADDPIAYLGEHL